MNTLSLEILLAHNFQLAEAVLKAHYQPVRQLSDIIQADLRNYRLLYSLEKSGLPPDDFHTNLGQVIFELIGFAPYQISDEHFRLYYNKLDSFMEIPVKEFLTLLPDIAENIRLSLVGQKLLEQCIEKVSY